MIDSGISEDVGDLKRHIVQKIGFCVNQEGYIVKTKEQPVLRDHGTIVAAIINHINPNVDFMDVNIFNQNLSTDSRVLLNALSNVIDDQPDIIHMSLGTVKKRYILEFKRVIWEARRKKILLVAAAEASGKRSYPAYLNGVIGVKADCKIRDREYYYDDKFFYAPAGIDGVTSLMDEKKFQYACGTSMSAAYITGHLAAMMQSETLNKKPMSYADAKAALIKNIEEKGM